VNYRNWQYGPVVETIDQLNRKLNEAIEDKKYLNIQSERIKEYMNLTDVPSSRRAAEAIYQYLNNNSGNLNR
jgi:CDP-glycerol glycerophosphotransferase (TagB/SpsB family)